MATFSGEEGGRDATPARGAGRGAGVRARRGRRAGAPGPAPRPARGVRVEGAAGEGAARGRGRERGRALTCGAQRAGAGRRPGPGRAGARGAGSGRRRLRAALRTCALPPLLPLTVLLWGGGGELSRYSCRYPRRERRVGGGGSCGHPLARYPVRRLRGLGRQGEVASYASVGREVFFRHWGKLRHDGALGAAPSPGRTDGNDWKGQRRRPPSPGTLTSWPPGALSLQSRIQPLCQAAL